MGRFLITTADERSWKFDRPVLFLGEWCRRYDQKHIWSSMDAVIATPYGLGDGQKEKDYARVEILSAELLGELAGVLNRHHGTNHSLRYWRILLGHWLHRYVSVIFNRFFTLEQAFREHKITGMCSLNGDAYRLATPDSLTFVWAFGDDVWNNVLCSKIVGFMPNVDIQVEILNCSGISGFEMHRAESSGLAFHKLKKVAANGLRSILPLMSRKRDAFIINSALPAREQIKLQLLLGQVPQVWGGSEVKAVVNVNQSLRKQLSLNFSSDNGFDQCVRALIFDLLPTCYLEGYQALQNQVRQLPWPSKPKFIFTSANFDTDEVFKAWVGLRVAEGVPYYIGQHGAYGISKYSYCETGCVQTSDKYVTWGWTDGSSKHLPAFIFTRARQKKRQSSPVGGLLLIELHAPNRERIWDEYTEFQLYQEDQFSFVESLPAYIQKKLTVRLHGAHKKLPWFEGRRWCDRSPAIRIDDGSGSIGRLIADSRLVVHSYDSTGIIETLSQNIPTLCFWQGDLSHLRESAKPYYKKLQQAGILQSSAHLAAKKVAEIWNDIPSWWEREEVQHTRREFCDRYAVITDSPAKTLKGILLRATNSHPETDG